MASEFEIIDNPTSTPEAVSTGYQAQNTNLVSQRAGLDLSVVEGGVGQVTVKIAGPVDVNGVLYVCKTNAILTPTDGKGRYVIRLNGSGNELTPELTKTFGAFDASKNAHYDTSGHRILNWQVYYDGTDCVVSREGDDNPIREYISASGTWTAPFSKYYEIEMCGRGGNGGNSDTAASGAIAYGGNGGGASYGRVRLWIEAGDIWTATFSTSSGGNLVFTDGAATLSVQNGANGAGITGAGGLGGSSSSGFTDRRVGASGVGGWLRGNGGDSFLGNGAISEYARANTENVNGTSAGNYGGGGSGTYRSISGTSTGGTGGPAVIIITG